MWRRPDASPACARRSNGKPGFTPSLRRSCGRRACGRLETKSPSAARPSYGRSRTGLFWRTAGGLRGGEGTQPAFIGGSRSLRRSCCWRRRMRRRTGSLAEPRGRARVTWGGPGGTPPPPPTQQQIRGWHGCRKPPTPLDEGRRRPDNGSPELVRR